MGELLELAQRVESAYGPDRALDWDIHLRNGLEGVGMYGAHPAYIASVDAALLLVPEGWRQDHVWPSTDAQFHTYLTPPSGQGMVRAKAATPALAIVAASLRALAGECGE